MVMSWKSLLVAILPGRFDPDQAKSMGDVISLLRRAGYPYDTLGEFYAIVLRDFSLFLAIGGLLAGAMAATLAPDASAGGEQDWFREML